LIASLAQRGWSVRGLELSGPQAEYCRARGLEVDCASFDGSGLPPGSFDAVTASHLIEHLNRPDNFVREAHRLLKRGGHLYITTPNIDGFQARLFGSRWRSAIFDHLYLFSRRTLAALLEHSGFRVERCRTWGGLAAGIAPRPVKTLFDKAVKTLGMGDVMILRALKT
jgi:2-polyprenyl-3-methyl-5-hydroxy-6-metoxy-1,4-benzoquinol methylase